MNESFGPKYILDISFIVWPLQQTLGERAVRFNDALILPFVTWLMKP